MLWKPSLENEPYWDSPWGKGRPGWHLECSAMSKKFLGNEFDIHGGGIDLIFPHHENEIAQSRCANDSKVFANYWLHNAFITMSNEKMAKSQGNILKIKDFRNKVSGQVLRLALISAHYKQPLDWNDKLLEDCQNTIDKWYNVYLPSNKRFRMMKSFTHYMMILIHQVILQIYINFMIKQTKEMMRINKYLIQLVIL